MYLEAHLLEKIFFPKKSTFYKAQPETLPNKPSHRNVARCTVGRHLFRVVLAGGLCFVNSQVLTFHLFLWIPKIELGRHIFSKNTGEMQCRQCMHLGIVSWLQIWRVPQLRFGGITFQASQWWFSPVSKSQKTFGPLWSRSVLVVWAIFFEEWSPSLTNDDGNYE